MNLPFETKVERALRAVRGLSRRITALYPMAYETPDGENVLVAGNDSGPYINVLGRASSDGESEVEVEAGESQRLLVDLDGRLWVRTYNGASVVHYSSAAVETSATILPSALRVYDVEVTTDLTELQNVWCLVYNDPAGPVGTPISRFFVPKKGGTAVRSFEGEAFANGLFVCLSLDPFDFASPATVGGFFSVSYQAGV